MKENLLCLFVVFLECIELTSNFIDFNIDFLIQYLGINLSGSNVSVT